MNEYINTVQLNIKRFIHYTAPRKERTGTEKRGDKWPMDEKIDTCPKASSNRSERFR